MIFITNKNTTCICMCLALMIVTLFSKYVFATVQVYFLWFKVLSIFVSCISAYRMIYRHRKTTQTQLPIYKPKAHSGFCSWEIFNSDRPAVIKRIRDHTYSSQQFIKFTNVIDNLAAFNVKRVQQFFSFYAHKPQRTTVYIHMQLTNKKLC